MNGEALKNIAKDKLRGNFSKTLLMTTIAVAFSAITAIPMIRHQIWVFTANINIGTSIYIISAQLIGMIVTPIIALLAIHFYTKMREGLVGSNTDIFYGLPTKKIGLAILSTVIARVFTLLCTLLLIIPGIIKSLAYSQIVYIIYDKPNISAMDAITESEEIMEGHKGDLFILALTFIGWDLLVLITLGIASFYVEPYKEMTYLEFYNSIKRTPKVEYK